MKKLLIVLLVIGLGLCFFIENKSTPAPSNVKNSEPLLKLNNLKEEYAMINVCTTDQIKSRTGVCYVSSNTYNLVIMDYEKKISNITGVEYRILNRHTKKSYTGMADYVVLGEKRIDERGNEFRLKVTYGVGELDHSETLSPTGIYFY